MSKKDHRIRLRGSSCRKWWEKPVKVFLIYALREERDESEKVTCVVVEAAECGGSKGEFGG
jgi:hypothetical protein